MLGHRLRRVVGEPITLAAPDHDLVLTATVTIGIADLDARGLASALWRADQAMYDGKAQGLSRVVVHDPDERSALQRSNDLRAEMLALTADNARLLRESREDVGTGLPNLRALLEELELLHEASTRSPTTYGLVFLDLDHFGLVNKKRGDRAGDEVLRSVADVLSHAKRATDTLYRKGGEELVVLVPDVGQAEAVRVAVRLRAALEAAAIPHRGRDDLPVVTASFGVATGGYHPDQAPREVMERAALCMLRAKETGRNRVEARPWVIRTG